MKPPVLMPPILGKPLILYISATTNSLGALLAQQDELGKERAIYYISRTLVQYELNYTCIEKAYLAIVFASQKIKHYMLAHTTQLVVKIDPLKYLLSKAALTGRLAKWMMILLEFDIQYVEQKAIKGQAIVDQLAEFPISYHAPMQIDFPNSLVLYITNCTWKIFLMVHTLKMVLGLEFYLSHYMGTIFLSPTSFSYLVPIMWLNMRLCLMGSN